MEIFKFGTDREDIGPFVSASLPIVCPSGEFFKPSTVQSICYTYMIFHFIGKSFDAFRTHSGIHFTPNTML